VGVSVRALTRPIAIIRSTHSIASSTPTRMNMTPSQLAATRPPDVSESVPAPGNVAVTTSGSATWTNPGAAPAAPDRAARCQNLFTDAGNALQYRLASLFDSRRALKHPDHIAHFSAAYMRSIRSRSTAFGSARTWSRSVSTLVPARMSVSPRSAASSTTCA